MKWGLHVEKHGRQHPSLDHSQVRGEGVPADDDLGLLVHLDDEHGQGLVGLVPASPVQDPPQLLPVDSVVSLLQDNEGHVLSCLSPLTRVDLLHQPGDVGRGGGVLLETSLVDPHLKQMGGHCGHLGHDGLLQDLGHVGAHHDGPDVLEIRLVLALILR